MGWFIFCVRFCVRFSVWFADRARVEGSCKQTMLCVGCGGLFFTQIFLLVQTNPWSRSVHESVLRLLNITERRATSRARKWEAGKYRLEAGRGIGKHKLEAGRGGRRAQAREAAWTACRTQAPAEKRGGQPGILKGTRYHCRGTPRICASDNLTSLSTRTHTHRGDSLSFPLAHYCQSCLRQGSGMVSFGREFPTRAGSAQKCRQPCTPSPHTWQRPMPSPLA